MSSGIFITEDGRAVPFNTDEWAFMPHVEDLKAGVYDLKQEVVKVEEDKITVRFSQLMPPLVKVR